MYYSTEQQQVASEPTLVGVADPNAPLVRWRAISGGPTLVSFADPNTALVEWQAIGQDHSAVIGAWQIIGYIGGTVGTVAGAYHGYKRVPKHKILGALWYSFIGGILWPIMIPIMAAQGFAKPKGS